MDDIIGLAAFALFAALWAGFAVAPVAGLGIATLYAFFPRWLMDRS